MALRSEITLLPVGSLPEEQELPFHDLLERSFHKGRSIMRSNPSEAPLRGRGLPLWERINRDPRYREAKQTIQKRYGMPLPFDIRMNRRKWSEWMDADEKRGQAFLKDVHTLFKKFEVPDIWYFDFMAEIAGASSEEENRR